MMRILIAVFALCALAGATHAQTLADPLAPAREGMVACSSPIIESRTCRGMTEYVFSADGAITSNAMASLQDIPPIVMHISQPVSVRDGMVCGPWRASDLDTATFEIDGAPAPAEQTQALRAALREALASRFGDACTTYTQTGETISLSTVLNGRPLPNVNTMIWVRPTDGYVLRGP